MSVPNTVSNGVAWLDTVYPEWRERVDWDRLDMTDARHCVFGQLLDPGVQPPGGGKGESPKNGYDVIYFYLKDYFDSRDAAFSWLRQRGHMESAEVWWSASFTQQP